MISAPTETIVRMVESLPETTQNLLVEKIRDYIEEIQDEIHWDSQFKKTKNSLIEAARKAKKLINSGWKNLFICLCILSALTMKKESGL